MIKTDKVLRNLLQTVMLLGVLFLAACGQGEGAQNAEAGESEGFEEPIKIGALHYIDHESMQKAETGFFQALEDNGYVDGENIEVEILNAQGTHSNLNPMAEQIAEGNDLILTLGTAASQAVANVEKEKSVIFTAVTDPVDAGLVASQEEPGGNITGASNYMPIDLQIELLLSIDPDAETVGVIYDQSEPNASVQAEQAITLIEEAGLEPVVTTVTSTNDVQQNLMSIAEDIDLLYAPTDNIIMSTISTIKDITLEHQIPSVLGAPEQVEGGGLATYSVDHEAIGYQSGEMMVDIIEENSDPATTPYQNADELILVVNEEVAGELGIDPDSIEAPE